MIGVLSRAFLPPALLVLAQLGLLRIGIYEHFPWFDIPMHFLGGAAVAAAYHRIFSFLETTSRIRPMDRWVRVLLVWGCLTVTTVLWEFMEFAGDSWMGVRTQLGLANTMQDLAVGMTSGLLTAILLRNRELGRRPPV